MSTYNNTFNGNFIQPSTVSYNNIVLSSNISLAWPTTYQDNASNNVLASYMTVQAAAQAPLVINLTDNPLTSTAGQAIISVAVPTTSNLFPGTSMTISGAAGFDNIMAGELNITAQILGIQGGNAFTYTSNGTGNVGATGGGNVVVLTYSVPYAITLPEATQVSNGTAVQIINNGDNPFFVTDFDQNFLVTLNVGNVYEFLLTDNTTSAGEWQILQAGTGTALANAAAIAGLGLTTLNGTLNTNFPSKFIDGNYTSGLADRGSLLVWTGGVGTITLFPNSPNGFPESVNNSGGGIVTITTTDGSTIDGQASFSLSPGESSQFISTSSGETWNSLGYGQETFFSVNTLSLDISAGGTINLTNQQASRLVQTYTGALAQNATITFPAAAGQWYVWNDTTNNFTVTLQLFGVEDGFLIPQGQKLIVYSDRNNIYSSPTTATTAIFNPGNQGSPSIVFTNDATTGFYSFIDDGAGHFGYSASGTLSLDLAPYGLGIKAGGAARFYNTVNSFYAALSAGNMASNVTWKLPLADATASGQIIFSDAAKNLSFTSAAYPTSTTINQLLYSSSANTIGGLATANNGVLITSAGGVPSIGSTLPIAVQGNITQIGTITSGTWNATPVTVPFGGTGLNTLTTAYGIVCAGTTATGNLQNAGTGTAGQILGSSGAAALPVWKNATAAAVKADQITGTSTLVYVNPAIQQNHASATKFWCYFNGTLTGTNAPIVGYNVTSVTRTNTGNYTINFIVPFSTGNYSINALCGGGANAFSSLSALTTSSCSISVINASTQGFYDVPMVCVQGFGTQ